MHRERPPAVEYAEGWPPGPARPVDRALTLLYVLGLPISLLVGWGVGVLSVRALAACSQLGPPETASTGVLSIMALGWLGWVAYAIVVRVTSSAPWLVRLALGTVAVLCVGMFIVTLWVPDLTNDRSATFVARFPECGPGNLPTWWPAWLPS